MSKYIDDNRPFTEEEKDWIRTRGVGLDRIVVNDRRFGHLSDEEKAALRGEAEADDAEEQAAQRRAAEADEDSFHPEDIEVVAPLTVAQLKERIKAEDATPESNKKEELQLQLLEILDAKRNGALAQASEDEETE